MINLFAIDGISYLMFNATKRHQYLGNLHISTLSPLLTFSYLIGYDVVSFNMCVLASVLNISASGQLANKLVG